MIHLCTIATLMFLQNNTSQKILFIAARTIQFPGVVFKVCIYLIVAIITSSLYFDVKSTHTLSKIYIRNQYSVMSNFFSKTSCIFDCWNYTRQNKLRLCFVCMVVFPSRINLIQRFHNFIHEAYSYANICVTNVLF